jgi:type I restriction enzyme S subunit
VSEREWKHYKLGEISDSCLGKMLDKKKNIGVYQPYLANFNVRWGGFDLTNVQEMKFEDHEDERYSLKPGDLVICEGGEPGRCAIWRDKTIRIKIQKALHRLRVHEGFNSDFLYYRMFLAGKTGELERHFIGSTIKHLTGISLKQIGFDFPCETEQTKISLVLRALDDKIELNNRINKELEAMAKSLYDYWFVQFDFPFDFTRGKPDPNGKPYKTSGGKMVYNSTLKREIPEGWEVGVLGDLGEIFGGSTPPTRERDNFSEKGIPWITPNDLSDNGNNVFISRGLTDVTEKGIKTASLKIAPAGTVLLSSRAPIGYTAIARNLVTTNQGFKSFIPNKGYSSEFILYAVKINLPIIVQNASGSTFKEISASVLKALTAILPGQEILKLFDERVTPIFQKINVLEKQNQQLEQLRDWLLPMLMNGQVRVVVE